MGCSMVETSRFQAMGTLDSTFTTPHLVEVQLLRSPVGRERQLFFRIPREEARQSLARQLRGGAETRAAAEGLRPCSHFFRKTSGLSGKTNAVASVVVRM
jgi:hypothetical protein